MKPVELRDKLTSADWEMPDTDMLAAIARTLQAQGDRELAATAYDRAYANDPHRDDVRRERAALLDAMALSEHGITWRYIPAGPFTMGSEQGEPDESPAHRVELDAFYLADIPVTWLRYTTLMERVPASAGSAAGAERSAEDFLRTNGDKIRRYYCGSQHGYDDRPMVAVSRAEAVALTDKLSQSGTRFSLPTEAQWEKAARGGIVGAQYAWGDAPPSPLVCDCERFEAFSILSPRSLPPNTYGLYGMCGGVWEWTLDGYDARFYETSARKNPLSALGAGDGVLRGGSWADCASAARVSFRMGLRLPDSARQYDRPAMCPTVGFRLARAAG